MKQMTLNQHAGRHSDYSREDYFFRRQSSTHGNWEYRSKPLRSRLSPTRLVDLVLRLADVKLERRRA